MTLSRSLEDLIDVSTSPSVYVVWSTVSAQIIDSFHDAPPKTLAAHYNVTKGYLPSAIMTVPGSCDYHGKVGRPWAPLNVRDLSDPPQNWIADQGCFWQFSKEGGGTGPLGGLDPNGTDMAANPMLSFPPDIKTLDSNWINCDADFYIWGAYDPPRALVPTNGFTGPQLTPGAPFAHTTVTWGFPNAPSVNKPLPESVSSNQDDSARQTQSPMAAFAHTTVATPWPKATMPVDIPATISVPKTTAPGPSHAVHRSGLPADYPDESGIQGGVPWSLGDPQANGDHLEPASEAFATTPVKVANAGESPVYILPNGAASVAGTIIQASASAVTFAGTRISVDAQKVYVGGFTITKPSSITKLDPPPALIDGHEFQVITDGAIMYAGKTISPSFQTTVNGVPISVGADRVMIGSSTYALPDAAEPMDTQHADRNSVWTNNIELNGVKMKTGPKGALVVGDTTIPQGQTATIDGIYLSIGAGRVVIGTKTYDRSSTTEAPAPARSSFRTVMVDGKKLVLPILPLSALKALNEGSYGHKDSDIRVNENGAIVVNGKTYSSGYQATASGEAVSLGSEIAVIAGQTYALPLPTNPAASRASMVWWSLMTIV